jgi:hypothetical protein
MPPRLHPCPALPHAAALALALAAALAGPALAGPTDELLRFVPDDVAFCVVVQDLRGHAARLAESPLAERFRASAAGAALRQSRELEQLRAAEARLRKHLGLGWAQLRDDILGDALVLAYRPGGPGKPDDEQGLVLLRARDAAMLRDLVERVNRAEKESGDLKELEEREYDGLRYYRRVEQKKQSYYFLRGSVLVFSGEEAMLRRALAAQRGLSADSEPSLARRLREAGAADAFVAAWFNPRALDADVMAALREGGEKAGPAAKTFAACWKAVDGVVWSLGLDRDLSVSVSVRGRPGDMPAAIRGLLREAARPSELWRFFPDDALLALGLHLPAPRVLEALDTFLPAQERQALTADLNRLVGAALGRDLIQEVLPAVGPDFGLYVAAPPAADKDWALRGVLAVRLGRGDPKAPVDRAVYSAICSAAVWLVIAHNSQHPGQLLGLRTLMLGDQEVKYLVGDAVFPPGMKPALGLREGYLVLASSPDLVGRFRPSGPAPSPGDSVPLLRIYPRGLRQYLRERRDVLAPALARKEGISVVEARGRLDELIAGLEFVDGIDLRQRTGPGQVVFTLAVRPAHSLKRD